MFLGKEINKGLQIIVRIRCLHLTVIKIKPFRDPGMTFL